MQRRVHTRTNKFRMERDDAEVDFFRIRFFSELLRRIFAFLIARESVNWY